MVIDPTRRDVLKLLGAAGAVGSIGTASALPPEQGIDELRLFSERAVDGALEAVTEGTHVYVATGDGMSVVDFRNPGHPETVASVDLADHIDGNFEILDVKADGDLAIAANNTENGPGGIGVFDVSDPATPQFQSFYEPEPAAGIHNCFLDGDTAYLTISEPTFIVEDGDVVGIRIFGEAGVEIVDLDDPANPTQAAEWKLRDRFPSFANAGVNPNHDLYVQDDLLYNAFWDAGVVVLDVSDPTDPQFVAQFGEAPKADTEIRPFRPKEESFDEYLSDVFPLARYLGPPGNAHYVQPSPDGEHLFVGGETFIGPSGIRVFDISDFGAVETVAEIDPPDGDRLRTAHNFDVTNNRLVSGWYFGGVRVHDITDPANPEELARYRPEGSLFWTAVTARSFIVGSDIGGGLVFLHDDRGKKQPPAFDGDSPPDDPGMGVAGSNKSAHK